MRQGFWILIAAVSLLLVLAISMGSTSRDVAAQMQPTPMSDRFAPWPTVFPPTQADQGAQEYYQRCMVCHGDRGEGLTDEWRGALDPADQNCWQSGCHSPHHPPGGFEFPKYVPPVIGAGTLTQFKTAEGVFNFIKKAMPYQAPGSLPDETYWQLTAYLLRANGYSDGKQELNAKSASLIPLTKPAPRSSTLIQLLIQYSWLLGLIIMLILLWSGVSIYDQNSDQSGKDDRS